MFSELSDRCFIYPVRNRGRMIKIKYLEEEQNLKIITKRCKILLFSASYF
mgnify:CR=1 FL=1